MDKINLENPIVCLITGPAGAGKTSVSKILAEKFERSAIVNVDYLRKMIVGGYVRPWPWNEKAKAQSSLEMKNACTLANNFLDAGYNVIIDHVIGKTLLEEYSEFFRGKPFKVFLLLPTLEVVLKRFDERGVNDELRKRTPELHQKYMSLKNGLNWQVIDSSNQIAQETADQIFTELTK